MAEGKNGLEEGRSAHGTFNPLYTVPAWIGLSVGLYTLRWSTLFPEFSPVGTVFLLLAAVAFFLFARLKPIPVAPGAEHSTAMQPVAALSAYYVAGCVLSGGPPIVLILLGRPYDIYSFGIPYLHVLALATTGYYAVRLFSRYLDTQERSALAGSLILVGWLICIANRGALSFVVFAGLILVLGKARFSVRRLIAACLGAVAFLVAFGAFGDRRLAFQIQQSTGNPARPEAILFYSRASDAFIATGLPATLMWSYLYLASPIANFFRAVEFSSGSVCGRRCDLSGLLVHGLLPDILGARLAAALEVTRFDKSVFIVQPDLTASTIFGSAFGYAGLVGGLVVLVALLGVSALAVSIFAGSRMQRSGMAILATFLFFCFFENMINFSPLSLQLLLAMALARRSSS